VGASPFVSDVEKFKGCVGEVGLGSGECELGLGRYGVESRRYPGSGH
jgi:hypothetical protein